MPATDEMAEAIFGPGAKWTQAPEESIDWTEKQELLLLEHWGLYPERGIERVNVYEH
jgi:hypothetical protein